VDLQRDVLGLTDFRLHVDPNLKLMDASLFRDAPMGLELQEKAHG
jgi:acyl CoA:acetate/3-ketoacid CoA transferase